MLDESLEIHKKYTLTHIFARILKTEKNDSEYAKKKGNLEFQNNIASEKKLK